MADRTASFRTDNEKLERLDRLAKAMDRSRSWLINDALERYMEYEEWFRTFVEEGIESLDKGKSIAHNDVMAEARRTVSKSTNKRRKS